MNGLIRQDLCVARYKLFDWKSNVLNLMLLALVVMGMKKQSFLILNGLLYVSLCMIPTEFMLTEKKYHTVKRTIAFPASFFQIVASRFLASALAGLLMLIFVGGYNLLVVICLDGSNRIFLQSFIVFTLLGLIMMGINIMNSYADSTVLSVLWMSLPVGILAIVIVKVVPFSSFTIDFSGFNLLLLGVATIGILLALFIMSLLILWWKNVRNK